MTSSQCLSQMHIDGKRCGSFCPSSTSDKLFKVDFNKKEKIWIETKFFNQEQISKEKLFLRMAIVFFPCWAY